jgi:hypothetical protein
MAVLAGKGRISNGRHGAAAVVKVERRDAEKG